jgi:hypothetical protein
VNDAERLSQDPTFRLIGSEKIWDRGAALPSRLHWFETEVLSQEENLEGLSRINRELLAKAEAMDSPQRVVLHMDSTEIPVHGEQEQSAYNGHFESTCYYPLLLFNGEGDCLARQSDRSPSQTCGHLLGVHSASSLLETTPVRNGQRYYLRALDHRTSVDVFVTTVNVAAVHAIRSGSHTKVGGKASIHSGGLAH